MQREQRSAKVRSVSHVSVKLGLKTWRSAPVLLSIATDHPINNYYDLIIQKYLYLDESDTVIDEYFSVLDRDDDNNLRNFFNPSQAPFTQVNKTGPMVLYKNIITFYHIFK